MTVAVMEVPPEIREVKVTQQMLDIMRKGARVKLTLRRWRGWVRLLEDDLGIEPSDDPATERAQKEMLKMGRKLVFLPHYNQVLASKESLARQNLRDKSYETEWGRFVPLQLYQSFKEEHQKLAAESWQVVQEMITRLTDIEQQVREIYVRLGKAAYMRLHPEADTVPEEYLATYVQRVMQRFPTAAQIEEAFVFDFVPERLQTPEAAPALPDEATMLEKALAEDINRHWHGEKKAKIDSFMADLVGQLRGRVYEVVSKSVEAMEKNDGFLPGKTVQGLQNLMSVVKSLDVYGDEELDAAFGKIKSQLDKPASQREGGEIRNQLDALLTLTRASLIPLDKMPRKSRETDLQMPSLDEVRQARSRLGVEMEVPVVAVAVQRARREL